MTLPRAARRGHGPGTALADLHLEPDVALRSDATLLDVAQVMTRSAKSAVVVGDAEFPHWLAALQLALRVDVRSEPTPTERSPERAR